MIARCAVAVAPVLPSDVKNYSLALSEAGLLRTFVCGAAYHGRTAMGRMISGAGLSAAFENRRVPDGIPPDRVTPHPQYEIVARLRKALRMSRPNVAAADAITDAIDLAAARTLRPGDRLAIGREDCCRRFFLAAHGVGATTVYDLPIAHHAEVRRALEDEVGLFPGAALGPAPAGLFPPRRIARKDAELAGADRILVASAYVRDGLIRRGMERSKIETIPYGCDTGLPMVSHAERKPIVLFVGQLSLRKGVPRLLRIWKRLGAYRTHTLRLIGESMLGETFMAAYSGMYERLPPVPRGGLRAHYSAARLFVFPSACDGFGLVLNEAMSCGTPLLASSHCGARGFIAEGEQGWTYEHSDDDALAAHLDRALSRPSDTAEMGRAAHDFAQLHGWPRYRGAIRDMAGRLLREARP